MRTYGYNENSMPMFYSNFPPVSNINNTFCNKTVFTPQTAAFLKVNSIKMGKFAHLNFLIIKKIEWKKIFNLNKPQISTE